MFKRVLRRRFALASLAWMEAGGRLAFAASPGNAGYDLVPWASGRRLPELSGTDEAGHAVSLAALRGKAVLINFWASWCEPCRSEMPALQALAERERARLTVLTVNLKESPEAIARFVQSSGLNLAVLRDPFGEVARAWGITIYPSTVLLDAAGQARGVVRGALDWAGPEGEALWRPLLAASPQGTAQRPYKR